MSQITYASPSWRGFIKAEEIARLNAVLSKARRFGYLPTDFHPLDDLLDASDESLFTSARYNLQHVLHQLLPPPKQISYTISLPVAMASPSLPYPRSSCAKTFCTVCCTILMSRFVSYFSLTLLFTLCACFVDYACVIVVIKESYYYYYY